MNIYQRKYNYYFKTTDLYKLQKYHSKLYKINQIGGKFDDKMKSKYHEKIIRFIDNTFYDSYERMVDLNEDCGFGEDDYDKFIKHNEKCIKKLSDDDLHFINHLIDKIEKEDIMQCDEEYFSEWDTHSIYFNINNKLVLMHPR